MNRQQIFLDTLTNTNIKQLHLAEMHIAELRFQNDLQGDTLTPEQAAAIAYLYGVEVGKQTAKEGGAAK